ncbi:MAG: peptidase C39 family protein [Candidatus Micrarchaeota archaeon]|nr:peptidase C39 family protein [Candidatus Micrarchaeota archaeon]
MPILPIPFKIAYGDSNACYPAAMQSALAYFCPDKEYTLEFLDKTLKRSKNKWTFTTQLAAALYELGLEIKYYSIDSLSTTESREALIQFFKDVHKENWKKYLDLVDIDSVVESTQKCMRYNLFENKKLEIKDLEEYMEKGFAVMVLIDHAVLMKKDVGYTGHFVILTGFDQKNFYYHENFEKNAQANKSAGKEDFFAAWSEEKTGRDTVVVLGKRK